MQQHQEPATGRKQVVHAVQLVRAVPFYGYHPDERLFIKIVLYNPGQVTRIATLLQVSKTYACCSCICNSGMFCSYIVSLKLIVLFRAAQ